MAASVSEFSTAFSAAFPPPAANAVDPTPRRRIDAIKMFRKNEHEKLSNSDFLAMIDILNSDKTACDTYLIFSDDPVLCTSWIRGQLDKHLN
jgi:hypothetical protein